MSKRPLPSDISYSRQNTKRNRFENFVVTKNVLLRNDDDAHVLTNIHCEYIMLGNFVYKVKPYTDAWTSSSSNHIKKTISLSLTQYNDVKKYMFDSKIIASSYYKDVLSVDKLYISLTSESNFKITTKYEEICQHIKKKLTNHIVSLGQNFALYYKGININIHINTIDTVTIGKITNETIINIKNFDDNIMIYSKRSTIDSEHVKVTVVKCVYLGTDESKLPLIIDKKILETYVFNALQKTFSDNSNVIYVHDNIEYTFKIKINNHSVETKIKNTYTLKNESGSINIQSNTPNLIITCRKKTINKICFSIAPVSGQKYEVNDYNIFVDELDQYIFRDIKILTSKQIFKYHNRDKDYRLIIDYINPHYASDTMYEIDASFTKIVYNTKSDFVLIKNNIPHDIDKVVFRVKKSMSKDPMTMLLGMKPKSQIFNSDKLEKMVKNLLPKKLAAGQKYKLSTSDYNCVISVKELIFKDKNITANKKYSIYGQIVEDTEFKFETSQKEKSITINNIVKSSIMENPILELEKYVGGISEQLEKVVRKICLSRGKLRKEFEIRGLKADRGLIFYGEPGTGKTTLARNLGKILGCDGDRFRLMSGPEIFNKWVGSSEENIRQIFKPAKDAWKKYGDDAPVYMVVIDEIDAMLPVRNGSSGNPVRDSVVNQFLSEMDGLVQFNNLICIGITNRLELLDPAAIRSGRFGSHIKIGLPDKKGRKKIFEIHTRKLKDSDRLELANFDRLIDMTDKFNGADIENVVGIASMSSLDRLKSFDEKEINEDIIKKHGRVTFDDFAAAIKEIREIGSDTDEIPPMYR